jgi:putative DNA methylase
MTDRRFIEESFPVKDVSATSVKEKNIRHGHISTLHIWWARRPLAASRATTYAALTPVAEDELEWQRRRDFIVELSKWENSLNVPLVERARRDILEANGGRPPRVLDPFAGGGAIPLEALRLGCETYASDYNPVAVLILKATLEYPQEFGLPVEVEAPSDLFGGLMKETRTVNPLLEAVKKWGNWVLEEAQKELARFYPPDPDGSIPVGYIWARTVPCQNPGCGAEIPLMRQFWLASKSKKKVALCPKTADGRVGFRVVGDGYAPWPEGFDPKAGTIARAVVTCPVCGAVIDAKTDRRLFREGQAGQRLVAVVLEHPERRGRIYRAAMATDEGIYREAEKTLQEQRGQLMPVWGVDPVPDEPLRRVPIKFGVINVWVYGMNDWGSLFNARQQLALITFAKKVRQAHERLVAEEADSEFATAVATYLGLILSRHSSYNATLCWWEPLGERSFNVFGRQAIPMVFDYSEQNPFGPLTGSWGLQTEITMDILLHLCRISSRSPTPSVAQASATQLPYPDGYFDAVLTDPPYYDNVPYSYLSDFFYVWLKRAVGHLHPDLFSTPLTPKTGEIVAYSQPDGGTEAGKRSFEESIQLAFQEAYRILKPEGVAVVVYTHKSTAGWEAVINALLNSGLVVTGAWPLHTEMQTRLRAQSAAALASSIYIVARKMARQPTAFYNEVREELRQHLDHKLQRLWEEGIGGADFFIAAIGSAIEVFGKYEQVMDYEGNVVRADRLLQDVRTIATDYAVRQILQDGFAGEVSDLTRLYVLWRWNYGEARVPFDEARKLAQSCGVDLAREWGRRGFVRKEREYVRLVGPKQRKLDDLKDSREMIDVLHRVLLLWEKNRREEMVQALAASGYGRSEAFYRVAQAISETLPNDSKEKKLLDGFLVGRERVREEVGKTTQQGRLFE